MAIGKPHLPDAKRFKTTLPLDSLETSLLTLYARCTRALSSFASVLAKPSPEFKPTRLAALGLISTLAAAAADATPVHHSAHHASQRIAHPQLAHQQLTHHRLAARHAHPLRTGTLSAQNVSGLLTPPAANLDAVLNPVTSIATVAAGATEADSAARYELRLHHLHTGEDLDIVYRVGNRYIPSAIAKLNYFLRDHRTMDVSHYDPREFDLLHTLLASLGRPNSVIDIVCGYRTPWSNNYLRTRAADTGVAKNSQHVQAKAIDIRVPGVSTSHLRDAALSLHGGGVGYYPLSAFVHVDVGPVRQWSFGGRGE